MRSIFSILPRLRALALRAARPHRDEMRRCRLCEQCVAALGCMFGWCVRSADRAAKSHRLLMLGSWAHISHRAMRTRLRQSSCRRGEGSLAILVGRPVRERRSMPLAGSLGCPESVAQQLVSPPKSASLPRGGWAAHVWACSTGDARREREQQRLRGESWQNASATWDVWGRAVSSRPTFPLGEPRRGAGSRDGWCCTPPSQRVEKALLSPPRW